MDTLEIYKEIYKDIDVFSLKNQETLFQILKDNAETEFGEKYGFTDTDSEELYCDRVPVSTYRDYDAYIERIRKGETNLTTSYDIYSMLETSGSTDKEKHIPITCESLGRYGNIMDRYLQEHVKEHGGKRLFVSFLQTDLKKDTGIQSHMLFTASYYRYLYENGLVDMDEFAGGAELNFFTAPCDYMYIKLYLAFVTEDITSFESVYLYDLLIFFKYFEDNYEKVLEDIETGHISDDVCIPHSVRMRLESLKVQPERIDTIRNECKRGFENIIGRLWKRTGVVSGIGSKAFKVEEISLGKYRGDIPVWHYIYAASECVMAVPVGTDTYDYMLIPGNAYYEFMKEDGDGRKICAADGLETGGTYELIITTFSGLYRYAMGDIIKVTGFCGSIPVIRFMYRRNLIMNIAGEKLDAGILDKAVREWAAAEQLNIWQYYFYEDYTSTPACYHGVIAVGDRPETDDMTRYEGSFDRMLSGLNRDYAELRGLGSIRMARLEFVDKEYFMNMSSGHDGQSGQPKPQHIRR